MSKIYYGYATGNPLKSLGIDYDESGILAFTEKVDAKTELRKILAKNSGLVGVIINLTPLISNGIISEEDLNIK